VIWSGEGFSGSSCAERIVGWQAISELRSRDAVRSEVAVGMIRPFGTSRSSGMSRISLLFGIGKWRLLGWQKAEVGGGLILMTQGAGESLLRGPTD
jgi:hypothetical protein